MQEENLFNSNLFILLKCLDITFGGGVSLSRSLNSEDLFRIYSSENTIMYLEAFDLVTSHIFIFKLFLNLNTFSLF